MVTTPSKTVNAIATSQVAMYCLSSPLTPNFSSSVKWIVVTNGLKSAAAVKAAAYGAK